MLLFLNLLLELARILAADGGSHWTYEGAHGQDHWPATYPECGSNAQSPIDIQTERVTFDSELPVLKPHGYDQPGPEPLSLHNNGHTVQLSLPPTLNLEGLPRNYVASQLHLHWGRKGQPWGSEHQVNSEATAAEVGENQSPAYEHILSHLEKIRYKGQTTLVSAFDVGGLLPPELGEYYRYNGSLTTPPCYQSVLWTVFHRKAQISMEQLEKLQETLFSTEESGPSKLLVQNYRAPQPLNHRLVLASFIPEGAFYSTGEMVGLGLAILFGCLCLLLAGYFIARKIRRKRLGEQKSVVFTSSRCATSEE
ncbi:carbonic anhydrase 14 isoform X2 [Sarcophilus harrisii]|uniref:Carbonic anhydrase 14 n=1 Tax=Sarcophilus harrisii TaxID=9305 RepID=A0A7N4PXP6_SARHA|nr:carbonic anhydrase 14 isoform X2 [Sarcophilus harrisii]XP_031823314.1 carbonic anhydrase 14 isoform X2 [Sarcophilus harrisii]